MQTSQLICPRTRTVSRQSRVGPEPPSTFAGQIAAIPIAMTLTEAEAETEPLMGVGAAHVIVADQGKLADR